MKKLVRSPRFWLFISLGVILTGAVVTGVTIPLVQKGSKFSYSFDDGVYKEIDNLNSKNVPLYQNQEFKNATWKDANQKATSDSTIIYNVSWGAIQHKLVFVSHIIQVLKMNPNKNIVIMNPKDFTNLDFIDLKKYPNVQIKTQDIIQQKLFVNMDNVVDEINQLRAQGIKIDYYSDDIKFFGNISPMFDFINTNRNNSSKMTKFNQDYFNTLMPMAQLNSINLFADGTGTMSFYDDNFYQVALRTNNLINGSGLYTSNLITKEITDLFLNNQDEAFKLFNKNYNPVLFLNGLIYSNNKGNDFQKTKVFLPSTQLINEINFTNTPALSLNDAVEDHFDPYNSLDANIISLVNGFNLEMKKDLFSAFDKQPLNIEDFNYMNNHDNYIYSPSLMGDDDVVITAEADSIIKIYAEAKLASPKANIQIILKGHPRDINILDKIKKKLIFLNPSFDVGNLFEMDATIPYELYLLSGIFNEDITNKKAIKLCQAFSTIGALMYSENQSDKIFKFYVNDFGKTWLNGYTGPNSKVYEQGKIEYI